MKVSPKLQVFCPVDPAELVSTPSGIVCLKCKLRLMDVSSPSEAKTLADGVCGVMRRIVGPVVGSTITLSSCSTDGNFSDTDQPSERNLSGRSEVPIPGTYFHPGGEIIDPDTYPIAERTSEPGIVISPYTQSKVDVSHVSEGTLVLDPGYKMADKKYFRVPSTPKIKSGKARAIPVLTVIPVSRF